MLFSGLVLIDMILSVEQTLGFRNGSVYLEPTLVSTQSDSVEINPTLIKPIFNAFDRFRLGSEFLDDLLWSPVFTIIG